jgi:hypothetical protein
MIDLGDVEARLADEVSKLRLVELPEESHLHGE